MANQITVQVYAIDNIPQRSALNVSFPTNQISAQLATSVLATNIQSQINYYPNPNNQAQLTEVLVSQSISDIATLASNSMFAASIYKINGYPQGGQALSMLFPSVQPSIWNVSGGGDVHSFVQFKGKKYYAHETGAALATAANTADGGGGGGVTNITYAALVTAIGVSGLTAGAQYRITDYATVHYIVDAAGAGTQYLDSIITGVTEPLIVTASSSNTLEPVAYSALHPEDIIHYDWNPANWLNDKSFTDLSGTPAIVTGFKGVIYFRHDTLLDNYMGYDFRNCRFRRWQADIPDWDSAVTYSKGNYALDGGVLYMSLKDSNINNTPVANPNLWAEIDHFSGEYICNNPAVTNGINATALFDDFLTFSENGATYNETVRANHFQGFKDKVEFDESNESILQNNVFFLKSPDYYTAYSNNIAAEFVNNTIIDLFETNTIGSSCINNIFFNNIWGNTIGSYLVKNILGGGFIRNTLGNGVGLNTIGANCVYNSFANQINGLLVGGFFKNNSVGNSCSDLTIGTTCQENTFHNKIQTVDFLTATHVYADYNTTIFRRVDGTAKLSYCDNSDVIQVVNANA